MARSTDSKASSTGTFVNNDFTSKLTSFLFLRLIFFSLFMRSVEFHKWTSLIEPSFAERNLTRCFANLCVAEPIPRLWASWEYLTYKRTQVYLWKASHGGISWSLLEKVFEGSSLFRTSK